MALALLSSEADAALLERRTNVIFVGCVFGLGAAVLANVAGPFGALRPLKELHIDDLIASPNATLAAALASRSMDLTVWLIFYLMVLIAVIAAIMHCVLGHPLAPAVALDAVLTDAGGQAGPALASEVSSMLLESRARSRLRRAASRILLRYAGATALGTLLNGVRWSCQVAGSDQSLDAAYPMHAVLIAQGVATRAMLASVTHPTAASATLYGLVLPSLNGIPWVVLPLIVRDRDMLSRARVVTAAIAIPLLVLILLPAIRRLLRSSSTVIASRLQLKLDDPEGPLAHLEQQAATRARRTVDAVCVVCGVATQFLRGAGTALIVMADSGALDGYMQRVLNAVGMLVADGIAVPLLLLVAIVHAHDALFASRLHVVHARFAQERIRRQREGSVLLRRRLRGLLTAAALTSDLLAGDDEDRVTRRSPDSVVDEAGLVLREADGDRTGAGSAGARLRRTPSHLSHGMRRGAPTAAERVLVVPPRAQHAFTQDGSIARVAGGHGALLAAVVGECRAELDAVELQEGLLRNRLLPADTQFSATALLGDVSAPCEAAAAASGVAYSSTLALHCRPQPALTGPESVVRYALTTVMLVAVKAAEPGESVAATLHVVPVVNWRSNNAHAAPSSSEWDTRTASVVDSGGGRDKAAGAGGPSRRAACCNGPPSKLVVCDTAVGHVGQFVLQLLVLLDWPQSDPGPSGLAPDPPPLATPQHIAQHFMRRFDEHSALERCARAVAALGGAIGVCEHRRTVTSASRPLLWAEIPVEDLDAIPVAAVRRNLTICSPHAQRAGASLGHAGTSPALLHLLRSRAVWLASRDRWLCHTLEALVRGVDGARLERVEHHEALRTLLEDVQHRAAVPSRAVSEDSEVALNTQAEHAPGAAGGLTGLLLLDADDAAMLSTALECQEGGSGVGGVRLIALSSDSEAHAPALNAAGCTHILPKPVFFRDVLHAMTAVCEEGLPHEGIVREHGVHGMV